MALSKFASQALIAVFALGATSSCAAEPQSSRSDAELEAFIKDYLLENPEVIIEAVETYQARQAEAAELAKVEALPTILAQTDELPVIGPEDAAVTIVEFFDYNCGYCKRATGWLTNELKASSEDVRVVFIDFPILSPTSVIAAKASLASQEQGLYLEFHEALMKVSGINDDKIFETAAAVGLDVDQLKIDMSSAKIEQRLDANIELARDIGVDATPGFFIGDVFVGGFNVPALEDAVAKARSS